MAEIVYTIWALILKWSENRIDELRLDLAGLVKLSEGVSGIGQNSFRSGIKNRPVHDCYKTNTVQK